MSRSGRLCVALVISLVLSAQGAVLGQKPSPSDRDRGLGLVTMDVKDMRFGYVIEELRKQTGWELDYSPVPMPIVMKKFTIKADRKPLTKILHEMGIAPASSYGGARTPRRIDKHWNSMMEHVFVPGASFLFSRRTLEKDAAGNRYLIQATQAKDTNGVVEWDIVGVEGGVSDKVEKCNRHSPSLVVVTARPGKVNITIAGRTWWYSPPSVVTFENPKDGDAKTVGPFTMTVAWPNLVVVSKQGLPYRALRYSVRGVQGLGEGEAAVKARNRIPPNVIALGGGYRFPRPATQRAWCGCKETPKEFNAAKPVTKHVFPIATKDKDAKIEGVKAIKATVFVPHAEPFRTTFSQKL